MIPDNNTTWSWIRPPKQFRRTDDGLMMTTDPETDLWQRTYYGFQEDSAPIWHVLLEEPYVTFTVQVEWTPAGRFDQAGVAVYIDSDNWMKASVEYEDDRISRLGSVVTRDGYSDWATTDVPSDLKTLWYRLSRREDDYRIETSQDGVTFTQMRIFHLAAGGAGVAMGVYAASPGTSRFTVHFRNPEFSPCVWELE